MKQFFLKVWNVLKVVLRMTFEVFVGLLIVLFIAFVYLFWDN